LEKRVEEALEIKIEKELVTGVDEGLRKGWK
jgi:hypothetical protein